MACGSCGGSQNQIVINRSPVTKRPPVIGKAISIRVKSKPKAHINNPLDKNRG